MPRGAAPKRLTDRKRSAIVHAAAAEFRSHGFAGTSMDQIAARARVSKRTVYNHFASKEELFQAIITRLRDQFGAVRLTDYDRALPLEAQLRTIAATMLAAVSNPDMIDLARVVFSRFLSDPDLAAAMLNERDHLKEAFLEWIAAAGRDGRLDVDEPAAAAMQFGALLNAFAFWPQIFGKRDALSPDEGRRVSDSAVAMFLARYGVGDDRPTGAAAPRPSD